MAEHTPGPWRVWESVGPIRDGADPKAATYWEVVHQRPEGADGKWIAHVQDIGDEQANACLIAAAPDLLAALERLVEYHFRDDYIGIARDIQGQAQAVIAKAHGEAIEA